LALQKNLTHPPKVFGTTIRSIHTKQDKTLGLQVSENLMPGPTGLFSISTQKPQYLQNPQKVVKSQIISALPPKNLNTFKIHKKFLSHQNFQHFQPKT